MEKIYAISTDNLFFKTISTLFYLILPYFIKDIQVYFTNYGWKYQPCQEICIIISPYANLLKNPCKGGLIFHFIMISYYIMWVVIEKYRPSNFPASQNLHSRLISLDFWSTATKYLKKRYIYESNQFKNLCYSVLNAHTCTLQNENFAWILKNSSAHL